MVSHRAINDKLPRKKCSFSSFQFAAMLMIALDNKDLIKAKNGIIRIHTVTNDGLYEGKVFY